MPGLRLIAAMLFVSLSLPSHATAGKRPHPHALPPGLPARAVNEIARLSREIDKLRVAEQQALTGVQNSRAAQVANLKLPALQTAIRKLCQQRQTALQELVDSQKLAQILANYQPKIKDFQAQIKTRNTRLTELNNVLSATTSNIQSEYTNRLLKLETATEGLEGQLGSVLTQRNTELLKLINSPAAIKAQAKLDSQIEALNRRIRGRQASQGKLERQKQKELAPLKKYYASGIAQVTIAFGTPEIELARLIEKKRLELIDLVDAQIVADIEAAYAADIIALNTKVSAKKTRLGQLSEQQLDKVAAIEAAFVAALAGLGSPLDVLVAELAEIRALQLAELLKLIESAKAQAIVAKYQSRIDALAKKVQDRDSQMSQLLAQRQSKIAQATAGTAAQIAKLDNAVDTLEFKLMCLEEQQWAAMAQVAGRTNVKRVLAKYDPLIAALIVQQAAGQKQLVTITQQAFTQMNAIVRGHEVRIMNLQREIHDWMINPHKR